jgi:hypothetical protein
VVWQQCEHAYRTLVSQLIQDHPHLS